MSRVCSIPSDFIYGFRDRGQVTPSVLWTGWQIRITEMDLIERKVFGFLPPDPQGSDLSFDLQGPKYPYSSWGSTDFLDLVTLSFDPFLFFVLSWGRLYSNAPLSTDITLIWSNRSPVELRGKQAPEQACPEDNLL